MSRIYFPLTGSAENRKAIAKVISFAGSFNMKLTAISVVNNELLFKMERYKIFIKEETTIIKNGMTKDAENYLNHVKKLGSEGGVEVTPVLLEGDPYSCIMDYIKHDKEDNKIVCVAKKCGGEFLKDIFSAVERKILLNTTFDTFVIGENV
ncbi:MAG: universal stress protein [Brevinematales bacterium]|jgi:nucleotide-binding universal stress UspA family protein